jgi:hypothetical protein
MMMMMMMMNSYSKTYSDFIFIYFILFIETRVMLHRMEEMQTGHSENIYKSSDDRCSLETLK